MFIHHYKTGVGSPKLSRALRGLGKVARLTINLGKFWLVGKNHTAALEKVFQAQKLTLGTFDERNEQLAVSLSWENNLANSTSSTLSGGGFDFICQIALNALPSSFTLQAGFALHLDSFAMKSS
jgi:hypothetical protein